MRRKVKIKRYFEGWQSARDKVVKYFGFYNMSDEQELIHLGELVDKYRQSPPVPYYIAIAENIHIFRLALFDTPYETIAMKTGLPVSAVKGFENPQQAGRLYKTYPKQFQKLAAFYGMSVEQAATYGYALKIFCIDAMLRAWRLPTEFKLTPSSLPTDLAE